jgi:hypothetical protein
MKLTLTLIVLFTTLNSFANTLPTNKADYCERFNGRPEDRIMVQDMASEEVNLMAFKNDGGLFNGGVCWWHSRFQRNIFYLAIFRPDLPKPNTSGIQTIIHQVRLGENVIIVPGYANFEEFSSENQKLIQAELNSWQLYDGVILGSWINGLKGDTKVAANILSGMMDEVYDYVAVKKKVAYEKLQIKGITSHAWLIVGMKKTDGGYELGYLDSNSPRMSKNYSYKLGDESFFIKGYGDFVPYLEFKREEERITNAGKTFCGQKSLKKFTKRDYDLDLNEAVNAK